MAQPKDFAVILKIFLLITIFILISLLITFLALYFVPLLKKQTNIKNEMLVSENEHKFKKLYEPELKAKILERAVVLCSCGKKFKKNPEISARKGNSCAIISSVCNSLNDCRFSCIGLGDCVKICPQEAIFIKNQTAVITELCNGCGKCVSSCPKNLIKLVPAKTKEIELCSNSDQPLTTCDSFKKTETLSYPEKKGFKIWKSCYKLLNKIR